MGRPRKFIGSCRGLLPVVCGKIKPLALPESVRPAEGPACGRALTVGSGSGSQFLKPQSFPDSPQSSIAPALNSGPRGLPSEFSLWGE